MSVCTEVMVVVMVMMMMVMMMVMIETCRFTKVEPNNYLNSLKEWGNNLFYPNWASYLDLLLLLPNRSCPPSAFSLQLPVCSWWETANPTQQHSGWLTITEATFGQWKCLSPGMGPGKEQKPLLYKSILTNHAYFYPGCSLQLIICFAETVFLA